MERDEKPRNRLQLLLNETKINQKKEINLNVKET